MPANRFEFRYTPAEVADGQRARFLKSGQFKLILLLWVASILFTAAPLILPGTFPAVISGGWGAVIEVVLIYGVTVLVLGVITPYVEFFLNRFWRTPLVLQFNNHQMRVSVAGKPGGLLLKWSQILRVENTQRVYLLFYGAGGKYIILPKRIFRDSPQAQARFEALAGGGEAREGQAGETAADMIEAGEEMDADILENGPGGTSGK